MILSDSWEKLDAFIRRSIRLSAVLLSGMLAFMLVSIVARYFGVGLFWGDALVTFTGVWALFLMFPVTVRLNTNIAMSALAERLPPRLNHILQCLWQVGFFCLGSLVLITGIELLDRMPGYLSEFGGLPKSYTMLILPVFGLLVSICALANLATLLKRSEM